MVISKTKILQKGTVTQQFLIYVRFINVKRFHFYNILRLNEETVNISQ